LERMLVCLAKVVENVYEGETKQGQSRAGAPSAASRTQGTGDMERILLSDA
jgi:hypothetical protein